MPTRARIATVCLNGRPKRDIQANRDYALALLDEALQSGPDLVCLPEAFPIYGVKRPTAELVEPLDGPTVTACAARAREHRCYLVCPVKTQRDGTFYNSAVIIGRDGAVVGLYDKVCPVTHSDDYTEFEGGMTPGREFPVFDLDFGRVAVQICFDLGFKENFDAVADAGARLVIWPSAYDGGFPLRAFAYIHHFYVVSAVRHGASRIIDPLGTILGETTPRQGVLVRDVNLDYVVPHYDFNHSIPAAIRETYGDRVDVRETAPGSAHFLVEPVDPAVTCRDLMDEFGFEPTQLYHDRHRDALARLRAGQPAPPQAAAHGQRPQYTSD